MNWKRFNGAIIENEIKEEVEQTLIYEKGCGQQIRICIGTDSQVRGSYIEFATVIVFLRKGQGGFMFVSKDKLMQKMAIKERMINEVIKSVNLAFYLSDILEKYQIPLEVHVDINVDPNYKSHIALHEAMGYIKGMGYNFKAKPNAFASSYCADKML